MSNTRQDLLHQQLGFHRNLNSNVDKELAVIVMKPGFQSEHINHLYDFLAQDKLKIVFQTSKTLTPHEVLAIYNDIFRFNDTDLLFGLEWKKRKLKYMTSGDSLIHIVQGKNAQAVCEKFKYKLRDRFNKLSVPDKKLSNDEFEELAIKNLVHVVDAGETEIAIWLFV